MTPNRVPTSFKAQRPAMASSFAPRGSIVALVTPMAASGALDWAALQRLVDWHAEAGTVALGVAGTTGESPTLQMDEHCELIRRVVALAAGRLPVLAGTGANATAEAVALTQAAYEAGADACLSVVPYYNRPTQTGLYRHYRQITEAVAIPQLLYNVPARTACDLQPDTVLRLAELPGIIGIKEASGDVERVRELLTGRPEGFLVYSGDDPTATQSMLDGADGVISVSANVVPEQVAALSVAALAGDANTAQTLDAQLAPLYQSLFVESNPIVVKWALAEMGRIEGGMRLPLTPLSDGHQPTLRRILAEVGAL